MKIADEFLDKDYAHAYLDEFLNVYLATQIKVLREQRGWTQEHLAELAGMRQERISVLENCNYQSWSIKSLKKLAEAFDLSLSVSFEEFGKQINVFNNFNRESLERMSRIDELAQQKQTGITPDRIQQLQNIGPDKTKRASVLDLATTHKKQDVRDFWNKPARQVFEPKQTAFSRSV